MYISLIGLLLCLNPDKYRILMYYCNKHLKCEHGFETRVETGRILRSMMEKT